MWFVLLVALSFGVPAYKLRDPGPSLTDYGKEQARLDSLAIHPPIQDSIYVRPDSL